MIHCFRGVQGGKKEHIPLSNLPTSFTFFFNLRKEVPISLIRTRTNFNTLFFFTINENSEVQLLKDTTVLSMYKSFYLI